MFNKFEHVGKLSKTTSRALCTQHCYIALIIRHGILIWGNNVIIDSLSRTIKKVNDL